MSVADYYCLRGLEEYAKDVVRSFSVCNVIKISTIRLLVYNHCFKVSMYADVVALTKSRTYEQLQNMEAR